MTPAKVLVLDTETATMRGDVYDVGYIVCDRLGRIYAHRSMLIEETFSNQRLMRSAYYGSKVWTHYLPMLERGDIRRVTWAEAVDQIRQDVIDHNVNILAAYNAPFDLRAMRNTNAKHGNGVPIFTRSVKTLCIWNFACRTIARQRTFHAWAREHGHVSENGNVRTSAEVIGRYVTGEWDLSEDHTALSDAALETQILVRCYAQRKPIPYRDLRPHPWRLAQTPA